MKILDADVFYDVVNETFPHDVISKEDILNLIDEMAVIITEGDQIGIVDYDDEEEDE